MEEAVHQLRRDEIDAVHGRRNGKETYKMKRCCDLLTLPPSPLQAPSAELVDPELLTRYFAKFDEKFLHFCDKVK